MSHLPPGSIMVRRLLPLLFLAAVGCGGKPTEPKPATEPAAAPTTAAKPPADPNAPTADATLTYWQAVGKAQELAARKLAALADPDPKVIVPLLTDTAKGIDELPAEKVDADAVAVGKGLADELRLRAEAKPTTPDAATKARTAKAALGTKFGREFPDLTSAAKDPTFRIAHDMNRPTLAQEVARLRKAMADLDKEVKPLSDMLTAEVTARDTLQGQADGLRTELKNQTEDADLKKVREDVLADAVKQLEVMKKDIDAQSKAVAALRAKKAEYDRLANEATAILTEGEPAKAEKLPLDRLDRLRVQAERVYEKLGKK